MTVTVRPATVDDLAALIEMAHALIVQHGKSTEHLTAEALRRDAFGPDADVRVVIAELDGAAAGFALYHDAYESDYAARGAYVCDVFVAEAARRHGVGRALMAAVARDAKSRGRTFLWWASQPWNKDTVAFYDSIGASTEPINAHALTFEHFETLAREADQSDV